MQDLKSCIKKYRNIDDELRKLNKLVYDIREKRKILELEIGDILKAPEFRGYEKLRIEEDGSTIRIQRPEEWNKSWSLSKKDMTAYIEEYFRVTARPTAAGCIEFILESHKPKLVGTDFAFTRVVPDENVENE